MQNQQQNRYQYNINHDYSWTGYIKDDWTRNYDDSHLPRWPHQSYQFALRAAFAVLDDFCELDDLSFYKEFRLHSGRVVDLLTQVYQLCNGLNPVPIYTEETLYSEMTTDYIANKTRTYKKMYGRYTSLDTSSPPEIERLKNFA